MTSHKQAHQRAKRNPGANCGAHRPLTALLLPLAGLLVGLNWAGALLLWLQRRHTSLTETEQAALALSLAFATAALAAAMQPKRRVTRRPDPFGDDHSRRS